MSKITIVDLEVFLHVGVPDDERAAGARFAERDVGGARDRLHGAPGSAAHGPNLTVPVAARRLPGEPPVLPGR